MCAVSMIGDHFGQQWPNQYPGILTQPHQGGMSSGQITLVSGVSQADFDSLKKEVLVMKELLKKAKLYDEQNNEPNCELEEKIAMLRKFAEAVGVSLDDIFERKPGTPNTTTNQGDK